MPLFSSADNRGIVNCHVCIKYANNSRKSGSPFANGDGYRGGKVSDLHAHLKTSLHLEAEAAFKASKLGNTAKDQIISVATASNVELNAFSPYFNNAYYLLKRRRPMSDFGALCNLAVDNGCRTIGRYLYHNAKAGSEIVDAIDAVVEEDFRRQINADPNFPIGLSTDESTSFKSKNLIVYVTYIDSATWLPQTK